VAPSSKGLRFPSAGSSTASWKRPLDLGILASVTRKHALLVAADVGLPVAEGTWPASRLEDASEVMVWSTTKEIAPVDGIDELRYEPGPVTEMLAKEFGGVVSR